MKGRRLQCHQIAPGVEAEIVEWRPQQVCQDEVAEWG